MTTCNHQRGRASRLQPDCLCKQPCDDLQWSI